jgi:glycine cleavage system H protein
MADDRTFLMGKFPAVLPGELRYARNHMWARSAEGGRWRFGFTSYAIRLMQDVYFLDWQVSAGDAVALLQEIGHIETSKAESDLFAPLAGTLSTFNQELLKDPSAINVDGYGGGWLFEMSGCEASPLLDAAAYHDFLTQGWEKTQRLIKGKINTED